MDFKEQFEKVEQQLTDEQKEKVMHVALTPTNIVRHAVSNDIAKKVQSDEKVKERIDASSDKLIDSGLQTVENEADAAQNKSNQDKLTAYFNEHKEELKTAGIDAPTYMEDMERGVKCHKMWSNVHWKLFGWWQTGLRTMVQKAKPFRLALNVLAILGSLAVLGGAVFGIIALINLVA